MTCRDCIHYNICCLWSTNDLDEDEAYRFCFGNFKSDADMVEVVRCKDCKHFCKQYDTQTGRELYYGICKLNSNKFHDEEVYRNHYCGYGKTI